MNPHITVASSTEVHSQSFSCALCSFVAKASGMLCGRISVDLNLAAASVWMLDLLDLLTPDQKNHWEAMQGTKVDPYS